MSFGRYLVQARELRGLELGEVAARTKIPVSTLEALETGADSRLPERVYALGYLKAYADAVGLDPDDLMLRFEEAHPAPDPDPVELAPAPAGRRARGRIVLAAGALLVLVVAAVLLLHP